MTFEIQAEYDIRAIDTYAFNGKVIIVNQLIIRGASVKDAIYGYAKGGHFKEARRLIKEKQENLLSAIEGFAYGGHFNCVSSLISNKAANINAAVKGYARAGHFTRVNLLISRGASINSAVCGYNHAGYLTRNKLPSLITNTNDNELKNALVSYRFHSNLLAFADGLGYPKSQGVCHGYSLKWLEGYLLKDEKGFTARMKKIILGGQQLIDDIMKAQGKNSEDLTKADEELINLHEFFKSIFLYQNMEYFYSVFNIKYNQDNFDDISLLASKEASSRKGLKKVCYEIAIYTENEIKLYLDALGQILEAQDLLSNDPVGLILSSCGHSIAIGYQPGEGWKLMDINNFPSERFSRESTQELAKKIVDFLYSDPTIPAPYLSFQITVIVTGDDIRLTQLEEQFNQFKKTHIITEEIACREEGGNLVWIAAQNGYADYIIRLWECGADLNKANDYFATPAWIAAYKGFSHVIAILGLYGADLTMPNRDGITPLQIAVKNGHDNVINELKKHNINIPNSDNLLLAEEDPLPTRRVKPSSQFYSSLFKPVKHNLLKTDEARSGLRSNSQPAHLRQA